MPCHTINAACSSHSKGFVHISGKSFCGIMSDESVLFAVGKGGSGKSTVVDIIRAVFPKSFICDLPQNALDSEKAFQRFIGKYNGERILLMNELSETKKSR